MKSIQSSHIQIRDPFVLPRFDEGFYYLYGTTDPDPWSKPGQSFEAYRSPDLENWEGPFTVFTPPSGFWGTHDFWAPEVHWYRGRFYMFATFITPGRKRGTHILVADTPLGPFVPVGEDPATPRDWQCLDGTLYVDPTRQPWIVFCREWVEVNDGEIWAAPLREDLGGRTGDPVLLFRASVGEWTRPLPRRDGSGLVDARVTDGPFLYSLSGGALGMLWSSIGPSGYGMGLATSASGRITGPWVQNPEPLVANDGGHGMIFRTFAGETCLTYHTPNKTPYERFVYTRLADLYGGLTQ